MSAPKSGGGSIEQGKVLHLGCGRKKWEGAIGVDQNPNSAADVLCDLNAPAYPFASSQFELIICEHILEHLDNVIAAMEEIHRLGKAGARLIVDVPHFSSVFFYSDPTHKHSFTTHSFDYFRRDTAVREFSYSDVEFRLLRVEFPPPPNAGRLKRVLFKFINRHIDWYEKHLAFILPRHLLHFELQVVK